MTDSDESYGDRLVDEDALESYLEAELGPADEYVLDRHEEGHSNETLFVTWGDRDLVVRRPPPGETAESAHDVLREYTVMDALQGTDVPVPETVGSCTDTDVIGAEFYLMERVDGVVSRREELERFATPDDRERIGEELVSTIAAIHTVDVDAVGLQDFGRPEGFTRRQVDRWADQYEWAFEVTADERAVREIHELTDWLRDNVPAEHPQGLVHGDYKIDNVMFAPEPPPSVVAVLDWEMATVGDPFTDLGWFLTYWPPEDPPSDDAYRTQYEYLARQGFQSRRELVDRYEAATGFEFSNDRFYRALGLYKLGGVGEVLYRRYLEGNSDDAVHATMEQGVPAMARRAIEIAEGNEPL